MITVGLCILIVGALALALWRRSSDAHRLAARRERLRRLALRRELGRSLVNRRSAR